MCVTAVLSVAVPSLGPFIMRHYGLGQMVVLRYSGLDLDRQKREMRGSWIMNLITESGADVQYLNRGKLPINHPHYHNFFFFFLFFTTSYTR